MTNTQISEKTIGSFEVRRNFGRLIQSILVKGNKYIVERHGEPVAAVVPLEVYQQWKQSRMAFFETLRKSQHQAGLSAEDADTLAREVVQIIRASNTDESRA